MTQRQNPANDLPHGESTFPADISLQSLGWTQLDDGRPWEQELAREVAEGHVLFGVGVKALASSGDDVLFELLSDAGLDGQRYAEVHLTWRGGPEPPLWPSTELFDDIESWYDHVVPCDEDVWPSGRNHATTGAFTATTWILFAILVGVIVLGMFFMP